MLTLPRLSLLLLLASLVTACGGSSSAEPTPVHHAPPPLASVDGRLITRADVQSYLDYTARFFTWANKPITGSRAPSCRWDGRSATCRLLRRQAIARLLQERVILSYAAKRGIRLSRDERRQVGQQLAHLETASKTAALFSEQHVNPKFMRTVLWREALVRKVQVQVMRDSSLSGPSFHIKRFAVPFSGTDRSRKKYQEAVDLATDGKPVPPNTRIQEEWIARFRTPRTVRHALGQMSSDDFIGPFRASHRYVVFQLLGRGTHRYGGPAREKLTSRYFLSWLARRLRTAHPRCYDTNGSPTSCPLQI